MLEGLVSTKKQEQEITGIKFAKEKWKSSCKDDMIKWKIWKILSHQKQWNLAICDNMDRPRGHYAKWNKSDKDKYYMISLICTMESKKQNKWTNNKTETDS